MIVVIAGPRDLIPSEDDIRRAIEASGFSPWAIVTGGAKGVDKKANLYARWHGYQPIEMDALWNYYRQQGKMKAAGHIRNTNMARIGEALIVIRRKGERTRGTSNMIDKARNAGLPIYIYEI